MAPQPSGPHVRLGLLWALVTGALLVLGPVPAAAWLAVVAGAGAGQAARSWKGRRSRPVVVASAAGAAAVTAGAVAGWPGVVAALLLLPVLAVAGERLPGVPARPGRRRARPNLPLTVLLAAGPGLAGASLVLARRLGATEALVLFVLVSVHDAANYVMGVESRYPWEGVAAAVASVAAVSLFAAAVLVPPLTPAAPWVLGAIVATLAPLGPAAGSALLGKPGTRVPVLRRLDSLLLAGPVWAGAATVLLPAP